MGAAWDNVGMAPPTVNGEAVAPSRQEETPSSEPGLRAWQLLHRGDRGQGTDCKCLVCQAGVGQNNSHLTHPGKEWGPTNVGRVRGVRSIWLSPWIRGLSLKTLASSGSKPHRVPPTGRIPPTHSTGSSKGPGRPSKLSRPVSVRVGTTLRPGTVALLIVTVHFSGDSCRVGTLGNMIAPCHPEGPTEYQGLGTFCSI